MTSPRGPPPNPAKARKRGRRPRRTRPPPETLATPAPSVNPPVRVQHENRHPPLTREPDRRPRPRTHPTFRAVRGRQQIPRPLNNVRVPHQKRTRTTHLHHPPRPAPRPQPIIRRRMHHHRDAQRDAQPVKLRVRAHTIPMPAHLRSQRHQQLHQRRPLKRRHPPPRPGKPRHTTRDHVHATTLPRHQVDITTTNVICFPAWQKPR